MRQIIEEDSFQDAVIALGGYPMVDMALDTIKHSLMRNPFGFTLHETQFTSFRFAITRKLVWASKQIPPLLVVFTIAESGDVHLHHVEIYEP
jgi:hypothetical protein